MSTPVTSHVRSQLLGVEVERRVMEEWNRLVEEAVSSRERLVVVSQNLHGVYLYHRHRATRALHRQSAIRVDGMPLIFWARLMGIPFGRAHRLTWVDWMPSLMSLAAERGWRVFFLGGEPGVGELGAEVFRKRHPSLRIQVHHGHFDHEATSEENHNVIRQINQYEPDFLLVGMGMPRQERWILENKNQLRVPVIMVCGAVMDYFAGKVKTPPRWMGRLGLEWLFRLATEPRRLWRRYLVEPWALLPYAARDLKKRFLRR